MKKMILITLALLAGPMKLQASEQPGYLGCLFASVMSIPSIFRIYLNGEYGKMLELSKKVKAENVQSPHFDEIMSKINANGVINKFEMIALIAGLIGSWQVASSLYDYYKKQTQQKNDQEPDQSNEQKRISKKKLFFGTISLATAISAYSIRNLFRALLEIFCFDVTKNMPMDFLEIAGQLIKA